MLPLCLKRGETIGSDSAVLSIDNSYLRILNNDEQELYLGTPIGSKLTFSPLVLSDGI